MIHTANRNDRAPSVTSLVSACGITCFDAMLINQKSIRSKLLQAKRRRSSSHLLFARKASTTTIRFKRVKKSLPIWQREGLSKTPKTNVPKSSAACAMAFTAGPTSISTKAAVEVPCWTLPWSPAKAPKCTRTSSLKSSAECMTMT